MAARLPASTGLRRLGSGLTGAMELLRPLEGEKKIPRANIFAAAHGNHYPAAAMRSNDL